MRTVLSLVGLLLAMAIVAILMKNNLSATRASGASPTATGEVAVPHIDTSKNVREQSQQIQQQVQDDLNKALEQSNTRLENIDK